MPVADSRICRLPLVMRRVLVHGFHGIAPILAQLGDRAVLAHVR